MLPLPANNHPDTILTYFACWLIGACAVPLNMTEDDSRIEYILGRLRLHTYSLQIRIYSANTAFTKNVLEMDSHQNNSSFYSSIRAQEPTEIS